MHSFVRKSTGVPAQYKKTILENCIRVCAKHLRPYRMFETSSFCQLAQSLIEIGAKHGHCDVKDILPSGVSHCFLCHFGEVPCLETRAFT